MPQNQTAYVKKDISAYKGVWVFLENTLGGANVRNVGFALLSKAREIADALGEELCAVAVGNGLEKEFAEIASYGADKIYSVSGTQFKDYNTDAYSEVMVHLIGKYLPSVVIYPSTYIGRDLAPRIAAQINVGLTADCTGLSVNKDRNLVQTRPAFGGNIMADILCPNHRPQMATVRPGVFKPLVIRAGAKAQVINESVNISADASRVKILQTHIDPLKEEEKLEEAEIIVSGGRGMKTKAAFALLEELAGTLGGAVGASRAAVDLGFKPKDKQVGQSGVTVAPKLYVACGISGAVQHIVGMEHSDTVIAINKDPKAPIFNYCKFGLVGDAHQIIPKIIEEVNKVKK